MPARLTLLRPLALLTVFALLLLAAAPARAQGPAGGSGADAEARIARWMSDTIVDLLAQNCLGPEVGRPLTASVYGLPASEPRFGAVDRERLGDLVLRGVRAARPRLDVSALAAAGALAPVLEVGDAGRLAEALSQLGTSALPVVLRARRPAPDVARLEVVVHARGPGGIYRCNRSTALAVSLDDLSPVPDARSGDDLLTPAGANAVLLDTLAGRLGTDPISLTVDAPPCALADRLAEGFRDAYARRAAANRSTLGSAAEPALPDILATDADVDAEGKGEGEGATRLALRYRPRPAPSGVVDLTVTAGESNRETVRRSVAVAVPGGALASCRDPAPASRSDPGADQRPDRPVNVTNGLNACGAIVSLDVSPASAGVGDALSVRARVRGCEPALFARAPDKLTPIPTAIFDRREGPDGSTLYEASPSATNRLVVLENDAVGTHRVGLLCGCAAGDREDLIDRFGRLDPLLRGEGGEGRLPDGTAYAFRAFERVE